MLARCATCAFSIPQQNYWALTRSGERTAAAAAVSIIHLIAFKRRIYFCDLTPE